MIPYVLLTGAQKNKANRVLEEHAYEEDTLRASVALLEEFGPDEDMICRALQSEERKGYLRPGTFNSLMEIMTGEPTATIDWRQIPRRGKL